MSSSLKPGPDGWVAPPVFLSLEYSTLLWGLIMIGAPLCGFEWLQASSESQDRGKEDIARERYRLIWPSGDSGRA